MNFKKLLPRLRLTVCAAIFCSSIPFLNAEVVKGVKVPDEITCGENKLILNGTAVRSVWGFKVYVAGLYLAEPNNDQKAIMTPDKTGKRVHMTMLREVTAKKFESTILDNIDTNFTPEEKTKFAVELKQFLGCFSDGTVLKKGSVVNIDFVPEQGTLVTVDGCVYDAIPGGEFYHTVLRLWIGKPPQESVKHGLLGKAG